MVASGAESSLAAVEAAAQVEVVVQVAEPLLVVMGVVGLKLAVTRS